MIDNIKEEHLEKQNAASSNKNEKNKSISVRILGVTLPSKSNVHIGLTAIYGLGRSSAKKICDELNIPDSLRVYELNDQQISDITEIIEAKYVVEGNLKKQEREFRRRLISINARRGRRLFLGLPRNSSSKHNSRTVRLLKRRGIAL